MNVCDSILEISALLIPVSSASLACEMLCAFLLAETVEARREDDSFFICAPLLLIVTIYNCILFVYLEYDNNLGGDVNEWWIFMSRYDDANLIALFLLSM